MARRSRDLLHDRARSRAVKFTVNRALIGVKRRSAQIRA
jgi:hypothetical protein